MLNSTKITVRASRIFGITRIEVELSDTLQEYGDYKGAIGAMSNSIFTALEQMEVEQKLVAVPASGGGGRQFITESSVQFVPSKVTWESKGGKRYYKVHGGNWEKFGVRVWEDVLEGTGIIEALGTKPHLTLSDKWAAVCEMNGSGNPKKIVKLWRNTDAK